MGLFVEPGGIGVLEALHQILGLASHWFAVDVAHPVAQGAGIGHQHFVGVKKLCQGDGGFLHRNVHLVGQLHQVLAGDARQDQVVGGRGAQCPVLDHHDVAVEAFGHIIAPVIDGFVHTLLHGLLGGEYIGQQVESFYIEHMMADIRGGHQCEYFFRRSHLTGGEIDQKIGRCARRREGVTALSRAPGGVPVKEIAAVLHLGAQVAQKLAQLLFAHGKGDAGGLEAAEKPIDVIIDRKGDVVGRGGGVVDAVAEIKPPIGEGDGELLRSADLAVVIAETFHGKVPSFLYFCKMVDESSIPQPFKREKGRRKFLRPLDCQKRIWLVTPQANILCPGMENLSEQREEWERRLAAGPVHEFI